MALDELVAALGIEAVCGRVAGEGRTGADQVREQLRVCGADDLLIAVGPFIAQGLGAGTRCASAPEHHRKQARDQHGVQSHKFRPHGRKDHGSGGAGIQP